MENKKKHKIEEITLDYMYDVPLCVDEAGNLVYISNLEIPQLRFIDNQE